MQKRIISLAVAASFALVAGAALAQATASSSGQTTTSSTSTTANGQTSTTTSITSTRHFSKPMGALSEDDIKADVAQAGYKEVKGLEFKDGMWQAKARGGNDNWVRIKVGPVTGKVYQADAPSKLNQDEVKAKLTAQGFQNIGDVKFDDGLWSADAKDSRGKDVDLLVDPDDGSVVGQSQD